MIPTLLGGLAWLSMPASVVSGTGFRGRSRCWGSPPPFWLGPPGSNGPRRTTRRIGWRILRTPAYFFPSVWAMAFLGDWAGGRLAASLDRRRQHEEDKLAQLTRTLFSEAAEEERGAEPPPPREED